MRATSINTRGQGFTLLELLSVMAIMVILMSIAGASYYGMSRGAALRGAASNLRSTLSLARQYAATRRASTHVLLWQDSTNAYYRTFVEAGTDVGRPTAETTLDVYGRGLSGKDASLVGAEIYKLNNLQQDGYQQGIVSNNHWDAVQRMSIVYVVDEDERAINWYNGDICGWAIRSEGRLPAGIRYDGFNQEEVVFEPDGTARNPSGTGNIEIGLREARGDGRRSITVRVPTGLIKYE